MCTFASEILNRSKPHKMKLPDSFVAIDFETLYSQRVSACSVGMVKYIDGVIVDRYYSLIRPPFDYPGKCGMMLTWIHGFTEDMLVNERTMDELLPEIEAFIDGMPLVAHNSSVERACFRDTISYYGLQTNIDYENIYDTYPLAQVIERNLGYFVEGPGTHSLDAVCRRFNIPELNHHNALDDAEMCGNLMLKFIEAIGNGVDTLEIVTGGCQQSHKYKKYNDEDKIQRTDLENVTDNPFKGTNVVLTGFTTAISQDYGHRLKELGAKVCTGVSGKTNWLICGANAGPSKMEKATQVGARIICEEEFLDILNNI